MTKNIIGSNCNPYAWGPYTAFGQDGSAPPPAATTQLAPYANCGPGYAGGYGGPFGSPYGYPCPTPPYGAPMYPPVGCDWPPGLWQAFHASLAARGSALVVNEPPTHAREQILGFQGGALDTGETKSFIAQPAQIFKPHRVVIDSGIAGQLEVNNITIGNKPQFVNSAGAGSIPARMLSEFATDQLVNFDTAQIGQQIAIQLTNVTGPDLLHVSIGMKGVCVQ